MVLFGASGHAKPIIDIALLRGEEVELIYDDNPKCSHIFGIPVEKCNGIFPLHKKCVISIGNNHVRRKIVERLNFNYISLIHPNAVISCYSEVGVGTVIMANAIVNPAAQIGRHCIINTAAVVEHDCIIDDYVHISPNAALAGGVKIGENTHIGIGACIIQGVKVGKNCIVGAGTVIIRDVPDNCTVVGNPAKPIKFID
ncbi:acetyltransferase [Cruoricaptor ignavus]|uniref:Acetyltransferase n=1 Tax=Cruoricaptor ignavus TaxID=1118202 RepID=A0A7M1T434_9FLAO|nr:acetyltransferase [Cruoricaptor ignavus]QOR73662.1 acetyltransferase [Cruoricaptor ignavus]